MIVFRGTIQRQFRNSGGHCGDSRQAREPLADGRFAIACGEGPSPGAGSRWFRPAGGLMFRDAALLTQRGLHDGRRERTSEIALLVTRDRLRRLPRGGRRAPWRSLTPNSSGSLDSRAWMSCHPSGLDSLSPSRRSLHRAERPQLQREPRTARRTAHPPPVRRRSISLLRRNGRPGAPE